MDIYIYIYIHIVHGYIYIYMFQHGINSLLFQMLKIAFYNKK